MFLGFRKLCSGIRCLQENGWRYTFHHGLEKCKNVLRCKALYRIWFVFHDKVMSGYKVYNRFITKYGENAWLFLTASATGDVYIFSECFAAYTAKRWKGDIKQIGVLGVFEQGGTDVAGLFGIKNVFALNADQFRFLYNLEMFDQNETTQLKTLQHHIFYRHICILAYLEGLHKTQLRSMAHLSLGINSEEELTLPRFDYNNYYLSELFCQKKIVAGKTVILAPYAKSVKSIPVWFWKNLTRVLKYEGLSVCTNSAGEMEPPIEGTTAVFVPYIMSVPFLEMAGICIGIRSGFLDVTNTAKCLKIALYPKDNYKRSLIQDINACYSMVEMYHQLEQYDMIYTLEREKAIIKEIVEIVHRFLEKSENAKNNLS